MLKLVNLEAGMPTVDEAMKLLKQEISNSQKNGDKVIKIIHGYGSSGKGGRIKTCVRFFLEYEKKYERISDYLKGEDFEIFNKTTQRLLIKCPELSRDSDLNRHNSGVTFLML